MRISAALAGIGLVALTACDPISEEQCQAQNWTGLGLADGAAGRPMSRFDDYGEICGAIGITPDRQSYTLARAEGLKSFCTVQNAFDVGEDGRRLGGVCPVNDMLPALQEANARGRKVHEAREVIDDAEMKIDDAEGKILTLVQVETDEARAEVHRLRSRIRDLKREIFWAERDIRRYDIYR